MGGGRWSSLPPSRALTPKRMQAPSSIQKCAIHLTHRPQNLTVEFHHILPVAWQLHTPVTDPPFPGRDPDGRGMLWDSRGVWLCPTSHRNVHHYIVLMMRAILVDDEIDKAWATLSRHHGAVEAQNAYRALTRYAPYGDLGHLAASGELGES